MKRFIHIIESCDTAPNFLEIQEIVANTCKKRGNYVRAQNNVNLVGTGFIMDFSTISQGNRMQLMVHRFKIVRYVKHTHKYFLTIVHHCYPYHLPREFINFPMVPH